MTLKYFAYGSNLHFKRFQQRVPSARIIDMAVLPGYQLAFHKHGADDSAKCNIIRADGEVHGVVYEMAMTEKPILDQLESGYESCQLVVNTNAGPLKPYAYIASDDNINHSLLPYHWYKLYVLHGAQQHGLDAAYCSIIESQVSINDPDAKRHEEHLSMLGLK